MESGPLASGGSNRRFFLGIAASSAALAILLYGASLQAGFVADDWDFLALVDQASSARSPSAVSCSWIAH